jgi:hypothetical protein
MVWVTSHSRLRLDPCDCSPKCLLGRQSAGALMLLAACANLGSLFAARAADRSREVAL